ncbi:MAG: amidohydrolase [Candidatus Eremiobacteraeota bacterium]|nr:amidohydrolase [Candidatus Eremiobacteraeota bacterium]
MMASKLAAVDVHVHAHWQDEDTSDVKAAADAYFGSNDAPRALDPLAAYYRERSMACVLFTVDEKLSGRPMVPNDDVLAAAARNPDVLIPFVSVDPTRGAGAIDEIKRLVDAGARGFKLHPPLQEFWPNDRAIYPYYEALEATRLPVVFHTGHSGIGTGARGGGGIRLKYGAPMPIDDVAVDFPDMTIVLAHPSFPWQDEAISICLHKPNVYIDLSGWSPKYFPPQLVQYANTQLKRKVLFGSDYPLITPDKWLAEFEKLPIRDEVRPLILRENAIRVLGLDG